MNAYDENLKISRILHAGYIFEHENVRIAFDPIFENPFSRNCYAFPEVRFDYEQIGNFQLDAVFISHFHEDHCSLESLHLLDRKTPIYIFCIFEELINLIKALGFEKVQSLELNVPVSVGNFEITPWPALDIDVDSIFQVKVGDLNVLNVVDSWIDPITLNKLAQQAPWDMVLWPFQTMREIEVLSPSRAPQGPCELPPEWLEQLQILNPKYIVPSSCQFLQESWSWYNHALFPISYQKFQQQIEFILPETKIVKLNPSAGVILNKSSLEKATALSWILPIGDQEVDYAYDDKLRPPSTAEISCRFDPLTLQQTEIVHDYCRRGIIEKYRSLEAPEEQYFQKLRIWRLTVYDHTGASLHFFYRIILADIEFLGHNHDSFSWSTEVPLTKIYEALNSGESLTSMYMRINDVLFEPAIEEEIQSADIVDDPLIRCLFHGVFGAYQKAQFQKIKSCRSDIQSRKQFENCTKNE